ncbi:MAG: hypothetical protein P4L44_08380 [Oryzomonas sp.]|uniref:hypothetical protein n=1 Tax=Oryzomonas sp. TaxID=2855186 RepID=UPI00283AC9E7|nr:hypothetical protein [Oryzomonas sp.]MDR3579962.1 hypothetical protein [Oryzomonas sp.]
MISRNLKIAGWLAMASAFLTIPLEFLCSTLEARTDLEATVLQTIIQIFGTLLFLVITLYIKRLLNCIFNFRSADRTIDLMIITGIVAGVLSVAGLYVTPLKESIGYAGIGILMVQGIVQAQFGYKLFKLPYDLGGMLKPFCFANIATGILLATIVLIPFGIVVSALSDLMLGTIFFKISACVRNVELKNSIT